MAGGESALRHIIIIIIEQCRGQQRQVLLDVFKQRICHAGIRNVEVGGSHPAILTSTPTGALHGGVPI